MQIAGQILRLKVTVVNEIPNSDILAGGRFCEVIGILDRRLREIVVAQKFGFEQSRFTLAHEIAHYQLHPGVILHRERQTSGVPKTRMEREADLFGAELLMPSWLIREQFVLRFHGVIDGTRRDCPMYYWLSRGDPGIDRVKFFSDRSYRAECSAAAQQCFGGRMISLCEFFSVSKSALAIQLGDLGLVK